MDQSRRAVESYWRSRMIDSATSDEDKVTPVYKLEEICELLRSSHVSIVKEVSEFVLKRLQHKSPIVKQKALRVIKYAVGKSGVEFRREMQRNSVAVRQLIHYKGQPDPLKGDSLNKAVRETAQEALSAIFANEESKASTAENLGDRIQGFGNTNFDFVAEDKKSSFLSEVVNIGSATIKQGLSTLAQSPSMNKNDVGAYRRPNLQRSLTTESDHNDRYEGVSGSYGDTPGSSRFQKNGSSGNWGASVPEGTGVDSHSSYDERTREERLLETIVTSGGVRLPPSRDALRKFLLEASKLDTLALSHALEAKLKSPMWQVRLKAVCVFEALLRKKDDEHFAVVALYFSENKDLIIKCLESPQASLREKTIKVLSLLDGDQTVDGVGSQEQKLNAGAINTRMPDLIDTGDSDNLFEPNEHKGNLTNQTAGDPSLSSSSIDDLLGGGLSSGFHTHDLSNDDPFADVSFHSGSKEEQEADLFSGMTVDKPGAEPQVTGSMNGPELFDIFGSSSEPSLGQNQNTYKGDVNDIMASFSINESGTSAKQNGTSVRAPSDILVAGSSMNLGHQVPINILNSTLSAQVSGRNTNLPFPTVDMSYNYQPGLVLNPSLVPQPINYNAMASMLAQQQYLATMSNFQNFRNLQSNPSALHSAVSKGEYSSPLPDVFNPILSDQAPSSLMSNSKKEETKAFDFISDHLSAARDPKRVI